MGASHVAAVYAQWRQLPDRPFRVLAYMALIAKDATPQPTYWGGRDGLCVALGLEASPTSYRIARRAVADLLEAGALERKYTGHAGKRSEYRVMVTPRKGDASVLQMPVDNPTSTEGEGGQDSPPEGGRLSPQRGTPESAKGDTTVPPRKMRNTRSESEEEISSTHSSTDRACEPNAMTEIEARRVIRNGTDDNGHALRKRAPLGIAGADLTIWCAQQILNSQEAS